MSKGGGSQQSKMNRALEELKAQAAKLGANGVLIETLGDTPVGMVGNYNGGVLFATRVTNKSISGKAIYVTKK